MSFEQKQTQLGCAELFLTCISRVSNAWGKSGNFLQLNLYVEAQKKLRNQNLKLQICRELSSARAGDNLIKTLARS